ncbi:MAG TPA: hypothetical protein VNR70_07215 [Steroidobacteraceae bacterium]|nr:hypothetical protein [Steroidobacteraceae bacterium]
MLKRYVRVLALTLLHAATALAGEAVHGASPKGEADAYPVWRSSAARALAVRGDAESLATSAALTFVGPPARTKADSARAASAAVEIAAKASELAPDDRAISWLHLQLCANAPACDIRDAATTMRWVDADNGAAWLPILAGAQKDRDTIQVDRVLTDMAQGTRFDLYGNRTAVLMFDALKKGRGSLPPNYLNSDLTRLTEAMGIAGAAVMPSFSPLINACRETAATERRETCLKLSKTMQRADAVMAQLVGFAIEKRLTADSKELRVIAERRRVLEWRVSAANQSDTPLLPWLRNARARSRLAKMRAMPREEDVCIALLREHGVPLDPPEEHR